MRIVIRHKKNYEWMPVPAEVKTSGADWDSAGSSTSGVPNVQQTTPYQVTLTDALGNVTTTEGGAGSAPCNVIIYPNVG